MEDFLESRQRENDTRRGKEDPREENSKGGKGGERVLGGFEDAKENEVLKIRRVR